MSVKDAGTVLLPFHDPLKPGADAKVAPGAIEALYDALVMVTFAPVWVKLPFHSWVIVCPLAKVNCRLQLVIAILPVFVMVMFVPKPPGHWLVMA